MAEENRALYHCLSCGKEIDMELNKTNKIICPFCGYRIIGKSRPPIRRSLKAR